MFNSQDQLKFRLSEFPCILVIMNQDSDFTIQFANQLFYDALSFTEQEVQYKYGNRMSALLDAKTVGQLSEFLLQKNEKPFLSIETPIKNSSLENLWLRTIFYIGVIDDQSYLMMGAFNVSDYKQSEAELEELSSQFLLAMDQSNVELFEFGLQSDCFIRIIPKQFLAPQWINQDVETSFLDNLLSTPLDKQHFQLAFKQIKSGNHQASCELKVKTQSGLDKWIRLVLSHWTKNEHSRGFGIITDITAEKEATLKYLQETLFYQSILSEKVAYAHADITEDRFLRLGGLWNVYNELLNQITYTSMFETFINKVVLAEDRPHYLEIVSRENLIDAYQGGIHHLECEFRRYVEQNKMTWMKISVILFKDPINNHVLSLLYLENIDLQKKQNLLIDQQLHYDSLTKIFNRKTTLNLIQNYIKEIKADGKEVCSLLLMDINHFSKFNAQHGKIAGDEVLIKISELLTSEFRKKDIIGRYSGDQFLLLLKDNDTAQLLQSRVESFFSKIAKAKKHKFTVSVGITHVHAGDNLQDALRQAHYALAQAKQQDDINLYIICNQQEVASMPEETTRELTGLAVEHKYDDLNEKDVKLDAILSEEGDITYVVDTKTYELICANKAFYNRIGISEADCQGLKCYEAMHHRSTPCTFCRRFNWASDKFFMYRNYNLVLEQEFLIKNKLISWNGNEVLLAIAVDLSNDKNVADTIENDTTENNTILSGINMMQDSPTKQLVATNALETIGFFFRSDNARFWLYDKDSHQYCFFSEWKNKNDEANQLTNVEKETIAQWLKERKWSHSWIVEGSEIMLGHSFEIYEMMHRYEKTNQRWVEVYSENELLGIIEINNVTINHVNVTFLDSFCNFFVNEWHKRAMIEDIIHQSYHDSLTDLLNRNSFEQRLHQFEEEKVNNVAIIMITMNALNHINNAMGASNGDHYLQKLTSFLKELFADEDLFRLNGSEFLVMLSNCEIELIEQKIAQLQQLVTQYHKFTISTGYAWDNIEKNLQDLVSTATQAMVHNKRQFYDSMDEYSDHEYLIAQNKLIESLEKKEFVAYLQPKVNVHQKRATGAEALVRWVVDGEVLPPARYIPEFERRNLIRYIDLFIFDEVCKLLDQWTKRGQECITISLNFSRKTLMEENLITSMETIFRQYKIDKKYIEIEITESYADVGKALLYQSVRRIRHAGYAISLDDFGTNYTNLSILSDLDVDVLKVDKSLIHSLADKQKNRVILKSVIQMCHELDIEVIAEGIEDSTQQAILVELGCFLIQGYLYSKPIPIVEFEGKFLNKTLDVSQ